MFLLLTKSWKKITVLWNTRTRFSSTWKENVTNTMPILKTQ